VAQVKGSRGIGLVDDEGAEEEGGPGEHEDRSQMAHLHQRGAERGPKEAREHVGRVQAPEDLGLRRRLRNVGDHDVRHAHEDSVVAAADEEEVARQPDPAAHGQHPGEADSRGGASDHQDGPAPDGVGGESVRHGLNLAPIEALLSGVRALSEGVP